MWDHIFCNSPIYCESCLLWRELILWAELGRVPSLPTPGAQLTLSDLWDESCLSHYTSSFLSKTKAETTLL